MVGILPGFILDVLTQEGPGKAFNGWADDVSLPDLVQLACLEGRDRMLQIHGDGIEGQIFFSKGEIVHATTPQSQGEEAFFQLMSWSSGVFLFRKAQSPVRTITTPWNYLLIEALRRADEDQVPRVEAETPLTAMVVEDSKVVSEALRKILQDEHGVERIINASNGKEALDMLEQHRPTIVTLDINMPLMGGDVALKHIMIRSPAPVVLLSGFSPGGISKVMEFLRLGAVDFIPKPKDSGDWTLVSKRLGDHVARARDLKVRNIRRAKPLSPSQNRTRPGLPGDRLLIILGGAGGLLEIQRILPALPGDGSLSVLAFQDMSKELVAPICEYLAGLSKLTISPLESGGPLLSSLCWAANWEKSWQVVSDENGAAVRECTSGDCSSLDCQRLLSTASAAFGERMAVLVLSGTDLDLGFGLQDVVSHGGRVFLQNPESALFPSPIQRLVSMELGEARVEPEEAAGLIGAWCSADKRDR